MKNSILLLAGLSFLFTKSNAQTTESSLNNVLFNNQNSGIACDAPSKCDVKGMLNYSTTKATESLYKLSHNSISDKGTSRPDTAKLARFIIGNKHYRYDNPWIGIHLTGMIPSRLMLDSGYRPGIGLNVELMSGDMLKEKFIGLSVGGSIGFTCNGHSNKQDVTLATPNNDKGYTRLYNMGYHMDMIVRAEFGNFRLKPYIDGVIGLRDFTTYQSINSYETIQGFAETNTILSNSLAFQYGMSAGLRWHWMPGVSVDVRGTLYKGTNLDFADVKHSNYNANTASYNLKINTAPSDMFVLHIGLLFDLDERSDNQKQNNKQRNNTTYTQSNENSTPTYNNTNNSGNGNSGVIVRGSNTKVVAPLKIKVPAPVLK